MLLEELCGLLLEELCGLLLEELCGLLLEELCDGVVEEELCVELLCDGMSLLVEDEEGSSGSLGSSVELDTGSSPVVDDPPGVDSIGGTSEELPLFVSTDCGVLDEEELVSVDEGLSTGTFVLFMRTPIKIASATITTATTTVPANIDGVKMPNIFLGSSDPPRDGAFLGGT